jgi:hypothetical protein
VPQAFAREPISSPVTRKERDAKLGGIFVSTKSIRSRVHLKSSESAPESWLELLWAATTKISLADSWEIIAGSEISALLGAK